MAKEIPLTRGYTAIVDDEDYDYLMQWKWSACPKNKVVYAHAWVNGRTEEMHRLLLGSTSGKHIDHIDGNGCNNTKSNLRICTPSENLRNRRKANGTSCKYLGVRLHRSGKWEATISANGHSHYLGVFDCAEDAARIRDKKAIELHGEFASLNFPIGEA